ncbi:MAG: glutamyl-tRNA reductase [Deltaproteobacteria bacterium]|nr:MAG: glutamyl-tRNA reductase [Deltaproteobacteria bacterium]
MKLVLVGLNHKTAPVEVREKFAFPESGMGLALAGVLERDSVKECAIVSTCNRVEIYAVVDDERKGVEEIKQFFAEYHGASLEDVDGYLYSYRGSEAIRHLFRVASSLDSMVLGEPQILGQVKDAYEYSLKFRSSGPNLKKLFPRAFQVAKRVRTETKVASSAVSVSYAAVELAKKIFSTLEDKTVMLIGAGEMSELAARHLLNAGAGKILVTNRTFERAVKLANEFEGTPIRFEEFISHLKYADIVISSTGAPRVIIERGDVERVIQERRNRPMFFIDMAVPRDIDPYANEIDNVYVYDIDDLQSVVEENIGERQKEARKAEEIVLEEVEKFQKYYREVSEIGPVIARLRGTFEEIRQAEVQKALSHLKGGDEKVVKVLEGLSRALMNKFLHAPTTALKRGGDDEHEYSLSEAVKKIFNLEEGEEEREKEKNRVER